MRKFLAFILFVFFITACQNNTESQPEVVKLGPQPIDSVAKVDSILKLKYNKGTFNSTMTELARWDNCLADQIDSSLQYVLSLPDKWKAKKTKIAAIDTLPYSMIISYTSEIANDYYLFDSISKIKPIIWGGKRAKPVIYIYPLKEQKTSVHIDFKGDDLYTWPKIDKTNTWEVTAQPNGMLIDIKGEQYPYLFWEGTSNNVNYIDLNDGFVVNADETEIFFLEKLKILGLNAKEYTDFITFWSPLLRKNRCNFIRFETVNYNNEIPLTIVPKPESIQRILMVYKPVDANYNVRPQVLEPFSRRGYTVIEWGGMELKEKFN